MSAGQVLDLAARHEVGLDTPVPVEAVTGFPETLDGRVKTLHPAVHAGLLADLSKDSHRQLLARGTLAKGDQLALPFRCCFGSA